LLVYQVKNPDLPASIDSVQLTHQVSILELLKSQNMLEEQNVFVRSIRLHETESLEVTLTNEERFIYSLTKDGLNQWAVLPKSLKTVLKGDMVVIEPRLSDFESHNPVKK